MKKVALFCAALLLLAACHCERKTTGTPCRKAACRCAQTGQCKAAQKGTCTCAQRAKKAQAAKAKKAQAAKAKKAKTTRADKKALAAQAAAEKRAATQAEELSTLGTATRTGNVINVTFKEPIRFGHNSDKIDARSNKNLDATANLLKKQPGNTIVVKGYTDSLGDPNYNIDLSQRRAQAVANALKARGVAEENISAVGYGASNPVATNATAQGRAQNRRVELEIKVK